MGKWEDIFGQKLKGSFDAGAGRAAGEWSVVRRVARTTFRLFVNKGLTHPWVREKEEIEDSIAGARADLIRSWNVYQSGAASRRGAARAEADWRRVTSDFRRQVADLNRRIAAFNLKAPSPAVRKSPLDAEREINRVMGER